jgi:16S rRNA (guanine966-N2)-methyltransferase
VVEAIFNILGPEVDGAEVLDLFAGSGALGLEALSRGAAGATFVDAAESCAATIRRNLAELGWETRGRVVKADAARWVAGRDVAGVVLLDPPYNDRALDATLRALDRAASPGTLVVAEHERGRALPDLARLRERSARRYGDTALTIFEVAE